MVFEDWGENGAPGGGEASGRGGLEGKLVDLADRARIGYWVVSYLWRGALVVLYVLMAIFQLGGALGWFCGATVSGQSIATQTPITPASYSFAVVGLTLSAQGLFVLYALTPLASWWSLYVVGPFVALSWVFQLTWVGLWTCEHWTSQAWIQVIAAIAMFAAYALAAIHLHTTLSRMLQSYLRGNTEHTLRERLRYIFVTLSDMLLVFFPCAVSAAWLLFMGMLAVLASSANSADPSGRGSGIVVLLISTLAGIAFAVLIFDPIYPATLVWVFLAVVIQQDDGYIRAFGIIGLWVLIGAALFAVLLRVLWVLWKIGLLTKIYDRIRRKDRVSFDEYN
jgi:hypothetical protein